LLFSYSLQILYKYQIMKSLLSFLFLFLCISAYSEVHWEAMVLPNSQWKYLAATSEPSVNWKQKDFDDAAWSTGTGGFGYGDGDDATIIPASNSLYLRIKINISNVYLIQQLLLQIDYDDAFVAYINGLEVARSANITDVVPTFNNTISYDHEAQMYSGGKPESYEINLSSLVNGENIFAVQILNQNITSSDISAIVCLLTMIDSQTIIYNQPPTWFDEPFNFVSSNLPIVVINTNNQPIVDEPKIKAFMGVINNGEGERNRLADPYTDYSGFIAIEIRGQSSQMFPKKSYLLETQTPSGANNDVSLMGMPAENDWILYALYTDKSLMRNVLTFDMYRKMGNYCSRTAYCELVLNGEYLGIYVLMERIKTDKGRVDIADLNPDETSGDGLTGGYIFKVDKRPWDYQDGVHGWTSYPNPSYPNAGAVTYQFFYPPQENLVYQQKNYLKQVVANTEKAIIGSFFTNREYGYNSFINVGSFIDFMIVNEITKEVDKYRFSSYFYKEKDSKGGEIFAGPIWDFNLGYGNVDYWQSGLLTSGWLFQEVDPGEYSRVFWWKRLMEDPYFRSLATTRWKSLRQGVLSNANITAAIDSIYTLTTESANRNFQRWQVLGTYVWPNYDWQNKTFADEVNKVRTWMDNRLAWMDMAFNYSLLHPLAAISSHTSGTISFNITLTDDYFDNKILKKKYFTLNCSQEAIFIDTVYYISASEAKVQLINGYPDRGVSADLSVTISKSILNGFEDLTTNSLALNASSIQMDETNVHIDIFARGQTFVIRCNRPALLPQNVELVNTAGQIVGVYAIADSFVNEIETQLPDGVYYIRLITQGKAISKQIIILQ